MKESKRSKVDCVQYQPGLGVKSDFERLIERFTETGTVRYEKFAEIWRDMKLSMYCAGRVTHRELREFVEECFRIAVQFLLPPSSFQVRAGAVYLLYGLYNFQLCRPKTKIRMTPDAWKSIKEFQEFGHYQQHLDIDYILHKMQLDKAFQFVFFPIELYPTAREIKDDSLQETFKEDGSRISEVFSSHTLNQVRLIHDQYRQMKQSIKDADEMVADSSVHIIHSDLFDTINSTIENYRKRTSQFTMIKETAEPKEEENTDTDVPQRSSMKSSLKGRLKQKAFETVNAKKRRAAGPVLSAVVDIKSEENVDTEPELIETPVVTPKRARTQKKVDPKSNPEIETPCLTTSNKTFESMPTFDEFEPSTSKEKVRSPDSSDLKKRGRKKGSDDSNLKSEKQDNTDSSPMSPGKPNVEPSAQDILNEKLKSRRKTARRSKKK